MRLKAFVFDDDNDVRSLLVAILSNRGYDVEAFADPALCPLMLDEGCPCPHGFACCDVIISDVNMPSITGVEFIKRQKRVGCKVENVALISGDWDNGLRREVLQLGCQVFEKPFRIAQVNQWLEECEKKIRPDRKLSDLRREETAAANAAVDQSR